MALTNLSYSESLDLVKAQVAASRTSFHAGMAILPRERREAMYGLYGFCRAVDDIADDSPSPEIATVGLEMWRRTISDVFRGQAYHPIAAVLLPAISRFKLDEIDFHKIIDGMEMDSVPIVAPTSERLDTYCDLVASAVGRVSVRIFGDSSPDALRVAHHLGRALQLTNILRDLHEDSLRGRLYLPVELLDKYSITSRDPQEVIRAPQLSAICRDLAELARDHYRQADNFMNKCSPMAMRPARIMRAYYRAVYDRLVALDWRNPQERVTLPKWKKLGLLIKGFFL